MKHLATEITLLGAMFLSSATLAATWDPGPTVEATFGTLACSKSDHTGFLQGEVSVRNCGSALCTSPLYHMNMPKCGTANWNDADIRLTGWKWNRNDGTPGIVRRFEIGVQRVSFSSNTLNWRASVGMDAKLNVVTEGDYTLHFEVLLVKSNNFSTIITAPLGCSESMGDGACSGGRNLIGVIPTGNTFGGFGISYFKAVSEVAGKGIEPAVLSGDVRTWSVSGSNLTVVGTCVLTNSAVSTDVTTCDITAKGFQGRTTELANHSGTISTSPSLTAEYESPTPVSFSVPANTNGSMCGQAFFELTGSASKPTWSLWAGVNRHECGHSWPGTSWQGRWLANMGSVSPPPAHPYPDPAAGTGVWPSDPFDMTNVVNAMVLWH